MFYDQQSKEEQNEYKKILQQIGRLSNLFSESTSPSLYYRAHENIFCKYFGAENLARHDCSADAKKGEIGIGLKTWVGSNIQKVAEFGKLRSELHNLTGLDLVKRVSEFRNSRIATTMNLYGIKKMIYHVIVRKPNKMEILEGDFPMIDIDHIRLLDRKHKENTTYFTDGQHTYMFNMAKTTLYMDFSDLKKLDEFMVNILDDPYDELLNIGASASGEAEYAGSKKLVKKRELALRLYAETKSGPKVEMKSGLNQWNAGGRKRHPDEIYIPFNKKDRERVQNKDFFPPRDQIFNLKLPDGKHLKAKVCQQNGKAIMSNPNKDLGKWLLRDILDLPEGTLVSYELLQEKGFDTVLFTKEDNMNYTIDFVDSKVYQEMYE